MLIFSAQTLWDSFGYVAYALQRPVRSIYAKRHMEQYSSSATVTLTSAGANLYAMQLDFNM